MEQSEYKDKHFHVVVSYWKEDGAIYGVELADKDKMTDEKIEERVRFLNEGNRNFVRKIISVDKELSQVIYFLAKERAKDKESYADRVKELISDLTSFKNEVEDALDFIREDIEKHNSENE